MTRYIVDRDHPALRVRQMFRRLGLVWDGNLTGDPTNWLFPTADFHDEIPDEALNTLMERTVDGNLSWIIFPPAGFRL